nr:unnamed protein product [Spirometra erinaceieuropaei]
MHLRSRCGNLLEYLIVLLLLFLLHTCEEHRHRRLLLLLTNTSRLSTGEKATWIHLRSRRWQLLDYVRRWDRQDVPVTKAVCNTSPLCHLKDKTSAATSKETTRPTEHPATCMTQFAIAWKDLAQDRPAWRMAAKTGAAPNKANRIAKKSGSRVSNLVDKRFQHPIPVIILTMPTDAITGG